MKSCLPPASGRAAAVGVTLLCGAGAAAALCAPLFGAQQAGGFLVLGGCLAALALYLLFRVVRQGGWGYYYDGEQITFAFSRRERWTYRWEELRALQPPFCYPPAPMAGYLYLTRGGRVKKIALHPQMEGYAELIETFRVQGLGPAEGFALPDDRVQTVFQGFFGGGFGKGG